MEGVKIELLYLVELEVVGEELNYVALLLFQIEELDCTE